MLVPGPDGDWAPEDPVSSDYRIERYRPRVEGLFARIERWTRISDGDTHWRTMTRDNLAHRYGQDATPGWSTRPPGARAQLTAAATQSTTSTRPRAARASTRPRRTNATAPTSAATLTAPRRTIGVGGFRNRSSAGRNVSRSKYDQ
ncbi:MAG: SpvB/TcaC N-terminal domain-containing protein [Labedaea sp.]